MSKRATTTWTFAVVSVAVFMASLDNLRDYRTAGHQDGPRRSRAAMDRPPTL
jgi:hypothetical protein